MSTVAKEAQAQGSQAWHDHRAKHANASEASAVLNRGRFFPKNQHELWLVKTGREQVKVNAAMRRGTETEDEARNVLAEKLDEVLEPHVCVREINGIPYSASLDGRPFASNKPHEIKVPQSANSALWDAACRDEIPHYYMDQLDHQLLVTGESEAVFFVYLPELSDGRIIRYARDEERIQALMQAWESFWPYYAEDREPERPVTLRQDEEWQQAAQAFAEANAALKAAQDAEKEARNRLVALAGESPCEGLGVKVTPFERAGSVDWKKFVQAKGLDPAEAEAYRKAASRSWRVTVENK